MSSNIILSLSPPSQPFQTVQTVLSSQAIPKQTENQNWPQGYSVLSPALDPCETPKSMPTVDRLIIKCVKQAGQGMTGWRRLWLMEEPLAPVGEAPINLWGVVAT